MYDAKKPIGTRTVTNPLDEDFTWTWDKIPYTVPARSTVSFVDYLAEHLAKHLATKILIEKGRFMDIIKNDKRIGSAVSQNEHQHVITALLDRDNEQIDLDSLVKKAKAAPTPGIREIPAEELNKGIEEPIGKTDENDEFEALSKKGYLKLTFPERTRYKELKDKLSVKV